MKTAQVFKQLLCAAVVLVFVFSLTPAIHAQGTGEAKYSREELAQMLAPIALYPDALLAQVLMASTYPLEIIEADRWIRQNPGLAGENLDNALLNATWDVSVRSLCHFPNVLSSLSQKIEQTSRLGDAFLAQEADVMDMIQELRQRAHEQGNLRTTNEQRVVVEQRIIRIEPIAPEIVYVPVYDPVVIYGPWWYPAYPPFIWWRPWVVAPGPVIIFGPRLHVRHAIGWSGFSWRTRTVNVYINKTYNFHRTTRAVVYQNNVWRHDTYHRKGVAYRDRTTAQRFGQLPARSVESRRDLRGFDTRTLDRTRDFRQPTVRPAPIVQPPIKPVPGIQPTVRPAPTVGPTPGVQPTVRPAPIVQPPVKPTPSVQPSVRPTPGIQPTVRPAPIVQPPVKPTPSVQPTVRPTPSIQPTVRPAPTVRTPPTVTRENAFTGFNNGRQERNFGNRGRESIGTVPGGGPGGRGGRR